MMVEPGRKDKFREGQVRIKDIIGPKSKAWRERDTIYHHQVGLPDKI